MTGAPERKKDDAVQNDRCLFQPTVLCLMHTGKPTGVAASHCMTWFQTRLILSPPPPPKLQQA